MINKISISNKRSGSDANLVLEEAQEWEQEAEESYTLYWLQWSTRYIF